LIPKKTKEFIPEVAKDLDLEESFVRNVVDFWWEDLRKALSDLRHIRINIPSFGTFQVRYKKLEDIKMKYEKMITNQSITTFSGHAIKKRQQKILDDVNRTLELYQQEFKRRELHKEKRYGPKKDMAKPGEDPGRD